MRKSVITQVTALFPAGTRFAQGDSHAEDEEMVHRGKLCVSTRCLRLRIRVWLCGHALEDSTRLWQGLLILHRSKIKQKDPGGIEFAQYTQSHQYYAIILQEDSGSSFFPQIADQLHHVASSEAAAPVPVLVENVAYVQLAQRAFEFLDVPYSGPIYQTREAGIPAKILFVNVVSVAAAHYHQDTSIVQMLINPLILVIEPCGLMILFQVTTYVIPKKVQRVECRKPYPGYDGQDNRDVWQLAEI